MNDAHTIWLVLKYYQVNINKDVKYKQRVKKKAVNKNYQPVFYNISGQTIK